MSLNLLECIKNVQEDNLLRELKYKNKKCHHCSVQNRCKTYSKNRKLESELNVRKILRILNK